MHSLALLIGFRKVIIQGILQLINDLYVCVHTHRLICYSQNIVSITTCRSLTRQTADEQESKWEVKRSLILLIGWGAGDGEERRGGGRLGGSKRRRGRSDFMGTVERVEAKEVAVSCLAPSLPFCAPTDFPPLRLLCSPGPCVNSQGSLCSSDGSHRAKGCWGNFPAFPALDEAPVSGPS